MPYFKQKKIVTLIFLVCLLFFALRSVSAQVLPVISNILLNPILEISWFEDYSLTADIDNYSSSEPVTLELSGINGDGVETWNYYADGTGASETASFEMTFLSGTTWEATPIRPDDIYPEIFFAPSVVTWYNSPSNIIIRRNNYHLLHFSNPFSMVDDMSFWIEFNAIARASNSPDLQIYLVSSGKSVDFFQSDWRNSVDVELVGTINQADSFHHGHTANSHHHLITLGTNPDGTIGYKNLDVSGDFWIILYNISPNDDRGWDLRYHDTSLCINTNRWYLGTQTRWLTTPQTGCPDSHVHIARRDLETRDGVRAVVTAGDISETQNFYFGELPNIAPNASAFTYPLGGSHANDLQITWEEATDANNDTLTYNLYLLDENGTNLETLATNLATTSYVLDTTSLADGSYGLKGEVCDDAMEPLCSTFYSQSNFVVDNLDPIQTLSVISISSNNSNSTLAITGDTVSLNFTATGTIVGTPDINFYSGGQDITDSVDVSHLGENNWLASFQVSANDNDGYVDFEIFATNLEEIYSSVTDQSYVQINNPEPTNEPSNDDALIADVVEAANETQSDGKVSTPSCNDEIPVSAPDLFYLESESDKVNLYFSPVSGINEYFISYAENSSAEQHGVMASLSDQGVQKFTINHLVPTATYYFKVRAQNGCATGPWSSIKQIKLNRFSFSDKKLVVNSINQQDSEDEKNVKDLENEESNESSDSDQVENKGLELELIILNKDKPLVGALIELHSDPKYGQTDNEGKVQFTDVEPGEHTLMIAYEGYQVEQQLDLKGDKKAHKLEINVTLKKTIAPRWVWVVILLLLAVFVIKYSSRADKNKKPRKKQL